MKQPIVFCLDLHFLILVNLTFPIASLPKTRVKQLSKYYFELSLQKRSVFLQSLHRE